MAQIHVEPFDDDFPVARRVDGVNVKDVAENLGFQRQFGSPRRSHTDWQGSKSGKRMNPPEYAKDDCGPDGPSGY